VAPGRDPLDDRNKVSYRCIAPFPSPPTKYSKPILCTYTHDRDHGTADVFIQPLRRLLVANYHKKRYTDDTNGGAVGDKQKKIFVTFIFPHARTDCLALDSALSKRHGLLDGYAGGSPCLFGGLLASARRWL
jgi:hypothetical protein